MLKHIKNVLTGFGQVLVLWPNDNYVYPSRGGFLKDADALRKDVDSITRHLRTTTLRYVKQINNRES